MTFGEALEHLKAGRKVQRDGWNGKDMWLVLVPGSEITVTAGRPLAALFPVGATITYHPHIDMKAADGTVFCWNPNQLDMLSEDWRIV
jgi:hypothetical protein